MAVIEHELGGAFSSNAMPSSAGDKTGIVLIGTLASLIFFLLAFWLGVYLKVHASTFYHTRRCSHRSRTTNASSRSHCDSPAGTSSPAPGNSSTTPPRTSNPASARIASRPQTPAKPPATSRAYNYIRAWHVPSKSPADEVVDQSIFNYPARPPRAWFSHVLPSTWALPAIPFDIPRLRRPRWPRSSASNRLTSLQPAPCSQFQHRKEHLNGRFPADPRSVGWDPSGFAPPDKREGEGEKDRERVPRSGVGLGITLQPAAVQFADHSRDATRSRYPSGPVSTNNISTPMLSPRSRARMQARYKSIVGPGARVGESVAPAPTAADGASSSGSSPRKMESLAKQIRDVVNGTEQVLSPDATAPARRPTGVAVPQPPKALERKATPTKTTAAPHHPLTEQERQNPYNLPPLQAPSRAVNSRAKKTTDGEVASAATMSGDAEHSRTLRTPELPRPPDNASHRRGNAPRSSASAADLPTPNPRASGVDTSTITGRAGVIGIALGSPRMASPRGDVAGFAAGCGLVASESEGRASRVQKKRMSSIAEGGEGEVSRRQGAAGLEVARESVENQGASGGRTSSAGEGEGAGGRNSDLSVFRRHPGVRVG